ncbi:MAG: phage head closure protein [Carnobacterium sp.]|uniref:phage head closure protein n=1 Tax=Carnobacterium sp. TaxID=48221 RepID=UPI003C73868B
MITRNMNERITFLMKKDGQNEDGEVVTGIKEELFTCWAEVSKATVKEFRERTSQELAGDGIKKRKDTIIFNIRYQQKEPVDSTMIISFRGNEYEILNVETDFMRKDFSMISAVMVE